MSGAQYDSIGGAYDRVAGLDLYHRLCWGVSTKAYKDFAEKARQACGPGRFLDAGCGSMLFSAAGHPTVGVDLSLRMLKLAQRRLGEQPDVALLQADIFHTPFRSASFDVILCLHVLHVLENMEGLLLELRRLLKASGRLFLTSVVLTDGWRDHYLRGLFRRGILASPRREVDIVAKLRRVFGAEPEARRTGSMLFTETRT